MIRARRTLWAIALAALASAAAAQAPPEEAEQPSSVPSASSPSYTLAWVALDANGGGNASSVGYQATVTIGQNVIGATAGAAGGAQLGFWYGIERGALFSDGFESGDTTAWDSTVGG